MNTHILNELKKYLEDNINNLVGDFVKKNNAYDKFICQILDKLTTDTERYWDSHGQFNGETLYIEFKKGNSIWLDLVRYSEIKLAKNEEAKKETITLFFIPNHTKTEIEQIIGLKTSRLIDKLRFSDEQADKLLQLKEIVPRSLNAQASLTVNDIKEISDFIITKGS